MRRFFLPLVFVLAGTLASTTHSWTAQTLPYLALESASSVSLAPRSSQPSEVGSALQEFRKAVLDLVNRERASRGLGAVKGNAILDRSAQAHAEDMLVRKYFSHTSFNGRSPTDRMRNAGYVAPAGYVLTQAAYGENIAKGQKTAKDVVNSWMHSAAHKANILSPKFRDMGLGYASGVWVQNFGTLVMQAR